MQEPHSRIKADLQAFYAAYNRRDWDDWLARADPELEWDPVEERDSFRGRETLIRLAENWLATWAQFEWTPEEIEIAPAGDLLFVAARSHGRSRGSDAPIEGYFFHVVRLRDGKPWRVREFTDRGDAITAFRAAGGADAGAAC